MTALLLGLDVSNYQKTLDWHSLGANYGLSFGFCKATEGIGFRDAYFPGNWADIKAAGLVRGAYHFARPEQSAPVLQADFFLSQVGSFSREDKLILDLEATGLSGPETNAWAVAWAQRVKARTGITPGIYTGSYLHNSTGTGWSAVFGYWWFPSYPAAYRPTRDRPAAIIAPPAPNVWGRAPDIWQYTDQFDGQFDASVFAGTRDQLIALGGSPMPAPKFSATDLAPVWASTWDNNESAADRLAAAAHGSAILPVLAQLAAQVTALSAQVTALTAAVAALAPRP